jgi:uncharacterized RDD family membrane protein YckC
MICRNHVEVSEGVRRCARCMAPFCGDCLVEINGRPYCATCKQEQLLDVRSGVDRTRLDLASPWRRLGALIIDQIIISIPAFAAIGVFFIAPIIEGREPSPLWNLVGLPVALLGFFYEALMLRAKNGQTLGRMALGVRVVQVDGSPLTSGQVWGRSALKSLLSTCCIIVVECLPAWFTEERTAIHDMVANTRVIRAY